VADSSCTGDPMCADPILLDPQTEPRDPAAGTCVSAKGVSRLPVVDWIRHKETCPCTSRNRRRLGIPARQSQGSARRGSLWDPRPPSSDHSRGKASLGR
jgi:hypothetical protein